MNKPKEYQIGNGREWGQTQDGTGFPVLCFLFV